MKRVIILFTALLFTCSYAQAQYVEGDEEEPKPVQKEKIPLKDRIQPGGNFSLSLGTFTYIDLSPLVGYRVTPRYTAGVGATYIYQRVRTIYGVAQGSVYGGRVFNRFMITPNIFAHAELESMNVQPVFENNRKWIASPLVGGGFFQPFGQRGGIMMTVLYNLNHRENVTPYPSPLIIRAGFVF
jgi:hypothetical protein